VCVCLCAEIILGSHVNEIWDRTPGDGRHSIYRMMISSFSLCPSLLFYAYVQRLNSNSRFNKKHFPFVKCYCVIPFERYPLICFENTCFVELWHLLCRPIVVCMGNLRGHFAGHYEHRYTLSQRGNIFVLSCF
jgi:hypothetical protein